MRIQANYFSYSPIRRGNSVILQSNSAPIKNYVSKPPSFSEKIYYDKFSVYDKFDPINASESELDKMAECCHADDWEYAIDEKYKPGFLTFGSKRKRSLAKSLLRPRIEKILKEKIELQKTIDRLSEEDYLSTDEHREFEYAKSKLAYYEKQSKMSYEYFRYYETAVDTEKNDPLYWLRE